MAARTPPVTWALRRAGFAACCRHSVSGTPSGTSQCSYMKLCGVPSVILTLPLVSWLIAYPRFGWPANQSVGRPRERLLEPSVNRRAEVVCEHAALIDLG